MTSAADRWRRSLEEWAIPERILAVAEESPWIHPPEQFTVPDVIESTPSHRRAREAMPDGGTVLDVGCGGGVAAFALVPPAARVIGVDHQRAMLEMFAAEADRRRVAAQTVEGLWPTVAGESPDADVVTAHHVIYNVGDVVPFLRALHNHARRRVVLEMPDRHPLSALGPAWVYFWQLDRPTRPTPDDVLAVLDEMGRSARREQFLAPARGELDVERAAHFLRVRLCLPAAREGEVLEYLLDHPASRERELSTIYWDAGSLSETS